MPTTRGVTKLEANQFGPAYIRRLHSGVSLFKSWLLKREGTTALAGLRRREIDDLLTEFVQWCFDTKINFSVAKQAILGIQKQLHLRFRLPRCWGCARAWAQSLPARHRVPLPYMILKFLFAVAIDQYLLPGGSPLLLPFAVLVRMGFFGLLRPIEMVTCLLPTSRSVRLPGASSRPC